MFDDRSSLSRTPHHAVALDCLEAAIEAAAPDRAAREAVARDGETLRVGDSEYDLTAYREVVVVGGGKASVGVARVITEVLDDRLTGGVVVAEHPDTLDTVSVRVGDHPVPSERTVTATAAVLETVRAADASTLVLFVVTGGASALLTAPAGDLSLADLRATTTGLLESGAPIEAVNAVRKHLSAIKGGQLARLAAPATVVTFALSDVVGNDLSVVGSGPTVPDETTYADTLDVLDRYDVAVPAAVRTHLEAGAAGDVRETPGVGDAAFDRAETHLVGTNSEALESAAAAAADAGYDPLLLTSRLRGPARHVGPTVLSVAEEIAATGNPVSPPAVVVAGGETTVTIDGGGGRGGPNQELALAVALELDGPAVFAAVDTDGEDGSSDAAGAMVDSETVPDGERRRANEALRGHDAGGYLDGVAATLYTGPTGTNVNDVVVVVIPEP
ncbi:glycerate kinase type-2 family protein [Haloarcula pellucida]|uniref:Hydroxypyruvate reductase n=1 Tax=Haloarcula pellucida TaxID=1427151 RepID=A0A830GHH0_9EURY|nr:DUF4147 domain-containing protein [Halomicroarcula pellucida]MBX0347374.1 DUF4147 domain-containing protein [Halomicroarcula pellucida]GGN88353.1 hydroxypyruvate reductase [Halomicroarcula pellucida]